MFTSKKRLPLIVICPSEKNRLNSVGLLFFARENSMHRQQERSFFQSLILQVTVDSRHLEQRQFDANFLHGIFSLVILQIYSFYFHFFSRLTEFYLSCICNQVWSYYSVRLSPFFRANKNTLFGYKHRLN